MTKERLQEVLTFGESPIWDAVIHILNAAYSSASENAIQEDVEPNKRAHLAGQAIGIQQAKQLLEDTRAIALERANRKVKT